MSPEGVRAVIFGERGKRLAKRVLEEHAAEKPELRELRRELEELKELMRELKRERDAR